MTLQDGFPITALCGGGDIQNGGGSAIPNATGISPNLKRSEKKRERFFNTAAFVDLAPGRPQFVFGNAARNTIIGPGIISFDASANKKFSFGESRYLEFRTEFFNMPNHPIFNPPGRDLRTTELWRDYRNQDRLATNSVWVEVRVLDVGADRCVRPFGKAVLQGLH